MSTLALCIPAYNAEKYLGRLLQSAKDQMIPFNEILVYNDSSSDSTKDIALKYGAMVVEGIENIGCSRGKNILASIAKSEWIHFHDADDELLPSFTRLAHKWIKNPSCQDIILFNYIYKDNETGKLLGTRRFDSNLLDQNPISYAISEQINPFCGVYRKKSFLNAGGYDTDKDVLYNEDSAMHLRMAIAGLSFAVEDEVAIINYRVESSMSQANEIECIRAQYSVVKKNLKLTDIRFHNAFGAKLWKIATLAASVKDWPTANASLGLAIGLGVQYPNEKGFFSLMCMISPYFALRFREYFIRIFKKKYRS